MLLSCTLANCFVGAPMLFAVLYPATTTTKLLKFPNKINKKWIKCRHKYKPARVNTVTHKNSVIAAQMFGLTILTSLSAHVKMPKEENPCDALFERNVVAMATDKVAKTGRRFSRPASSFVPLMVLQRLVHRKVEGIMRKTHPAVLILPATIRTFPFASDDCAARNEPVAEDLPSPLRSWLPAT